MNKPKFFLDKGLTSTLQPVYCCAHVALPHHRWNSYTLASTFSGGACTRTHYSAPRCGIVGVQTVARFNKNPAPASVAGFFIF